MATADEVERRRRDKVAAHLGDDQPGGKEAAAGQSSRAAAPTFLNDVRRGVFEDGGLSVEDAVRRRQHYHQRQQP